MLAPGFPTHPFRLVFIKVLGELLAVEQFTLKFTRPGLPNGPLADGATNILCPVPQCFK
jgi:hypothetical protein